MVNLGSGLLRYGIAAVILLAGCSQEDAADDSQIARPSSREFSAQDKAVAAALSLGNDSLVEAAEGPYAQAVLCTGALDAFVVRLNESGRSSAEVVDTLRQARQIYQLRLRTLATGEAKSRSDVERDVQQAAEQEVTYATNARVVLGCIKDLEGPA